MQLHVADCKTWIFIYLKLIIQNSGATVLADLELESQYSVDYFDGVLADYDSNLSL